MIGSRPRAKVPEIARQGEVIEIKTLITHRMESGQRPDGTGGKIPRHIINRFTATFNGQPVIDVTLEPATSANPYLSFYMRAEMSGEFLFTWFDDDGSIYTTTAAMTVT
ncbi:thiosulfate oxidation carrier complex protein SoxZ [Alphaproteobacteria bacterium HT1-32]|nr:thiosulfate oxidation carrier complex protein SoxZ [Alphaproteobacteria bacterium HT1-32]